MGELTVARMSARRSSHIRSSCRKWFASRFASVENPPCFQLARIERAKPSGVRGPVLAPPCIRHRPFGMAGALQAGPLRVSAPHLGEVLKSPGGLPFFSQPLRFAWGSLSGILFIPSPGLLALLRLLPIRTQGDSADDGLTAVLNGHMLHGHTLFAGTAVFL